MVWKDVHNKKWVFGIRLPTSESITDQGPQAAALGNLSTMFVPRPHPYCLARNQ